jgi:hypothetical protein
VRALAEGIIEKAGKDIVPYDYRCMNESTTPNLEKLGRLWPIRNDAYQEFKDLLKDKYGFVNARGWDKKYKDEALGEIAAIHPDKDFILKYAGNEKSFYGDQKREVGVRYENLSARTY